MLDSGYLSFGFAQEPVKFPGIPSREKSLTEGFSAHQAGNPSKSLHVLACGCFRADEQEKKAHRLAIERIEGYRRGGDTCRESQFPNPL
jgi:hypothetical protein